ncbi:MAG: 50S ribosomal protein L18e, partial [Nanoarchaeota archaeon]
MTKTKTKIESQIRRKTNNELVETTIAAKKKVKWLEVASILSSPRRESIDLNLGQIDFLAKEGDVVVIPGKVLSQGEIKKKIRVVAYKFSEKAKEKLLKEKIQISSIMDEIKKNPEAKGVRVLIK